MRLICSSSHSLAMLSTSATTFKDDVKGITARHDLAILSAEQLQLEPTGAYCSILACARQGSAVRIEISRKLTSCCEPYLSFKIVHAICSVVLLCSRARHRRVCALPVDLLTQTTQLPSTLTSFCTVKCQAHITDPAGNPSAMPSRRYVYPGRSPPSERHAWRVDSSEHYLMTLFMSYA